MTVIWWWHHDADDVSCWLHISKLIYIQLQIYKRYNKLYVHCISTRFHIREISQNINNINDFITIMPCDWLVEQHEMKLGYHGTASQRRVIDPRADTFNPFISWLLVPCGWSFYAATGCSSCQLRVGEFDCSAFWWHHNCMTDVTLSLWWGCGISAWRWPQPEQESPS